MVLRIFLFLAGTFLAWYSFTREHVVRISSSAVAHKGRVWKTVLHFSEASRII